jgi:two-component system CAI-1 autoinducer sensor kinase/phosphatase CqsS
MTKNSQKQTKDQSKLQTLKSLAALIASETKDPLCGIRSACDIIKDNLDSAMKFIDLIAFSSSRSLVFADMILQNINDEGELDRSDFEELSIRDVVKDAIAQYLFNGREEIDLLNINYADDFKFFGDKVLMSFVILNLLKNSIVHKARIDVWFDSSVKCIYWRDEGNGIPADKLPYVFEDVLVRNKKNNLGMGLPFCKRIMKAFGGDICFKSAEGKGTEFCLRF